MGGVSFHSGTGYRSQLDRARRFLDRVLSDEPHRDLDYQDDVWAFFQNCWHIIDWVGHDKRIPKAARQTVISAALASRVLLVCRDMANGTKHCKLTRRRKKKRPQVVRGRAMHLLTNTAITPGGSTTIDCVVRFPRRKIKLRSAREVAKECLAEWERILKKHGLSIAQLS